MLLLAALAWPFGAAAAASGAEEAFQRGVTAVQAGDYAEAVAAFEAARAAGMDTGAVHFNLGVAHYRQGSLDAARAAFRRATDDPSLAGPAYYNLGRIAREAGEPVAAAGWFDRAARAARTSAVRDEARAARDALNVPVADTRTAGGELALGLGYDSNVPLAPADAFAGTDTADAFAWGQLGLEAPAGPSGRVFADLYAERFDDVGDFDLATVSAGYARRLDTATWGREARATAQYVRYAGETFEYGLGLGGTAWRGRGDGGWLELEAEVHVLRGGTGFGYLDGTQLTTRAAIGAPVGAAGYWQAGIRLDRQDREDLASGDDFFSFSRTEVGGFIQRGGRLAANLRWSLDARAALRDYAGAERRNGASVGSRRDYMLEAGAGIERRLGPRWDLTADLTLARRTSNIDAFDYARGVVRVGIRRGF